MNRSASVSVSQTHGAARSWIDIHTRAVVFLRRGMRGGGGSVAGFVSSGVRWKCEF